MAKWRDDSRRVPDRHEGRHDRYGSDGHDRGGRREDPDEFPEPVPGRDRGQDDRFGRGGIEAGYSGRYEDRADGGFANYGGRPGSVSGGRYGSYREEG